MLTEASGHLYMYRAYTMLTKASEARNTVDKSSNDAPEQLHSRKGTISKQKVILSSGWVT